MNPLMVTDLKTRMTFIGEIWRKQSKTIHTSVMHASYPFGPDKRIRYGRVPLYIRRAMRAALGGAA